ncbi:hypothetical protein SpCBS45565_g01187 [Spizellomyces sp. 'palustris']|nr:hypothetical protein SpCBS45565_g01187 [Spizellomyces sp. 'palustris']
MARGLFRPIGLLVRKEYQVRRRALASQFCIALLLPLVVIALVIYTWSNFNNFANTTVQPVHSDIRNLVSNLGPVAYVINAASPEANAIVTELSRSAGSLRQFASDDQMNVYCRINDCLAGIVLHGPTSGGGWNYTLRMDPIERQWARFNVKPPEAMADVQVAIERSIISAIHPTLASTLSASKVSTQQVQGAAVKAMFYAFMEGWSGGMIICVFLPMLYSIVAAILEEKQSKLREGMFMMGLSRASYNLSWLVTYAVLFLPAWLISAVIMKATFYTKTNLFILFLWLVISSLPVIGWAFILEVLMKSPRSGGLFSIALFTGVGAAAMFINNNQWDLGPAAKVALSFISPFSFVYANRVIAHQEGRLTGVHFANWSEEYQGIRFTTCLLILVLDAILYACLGWYLEKIVTSASSGHQPWYSFWRGDPAHQIHNAPFSPLSNDAPLIEDTPSSGQIGISIRDLSRSFRHPTTGKVQHAVQDLTLDAYEGETMVLLGKNGAGKTTLISMLTGLLPPTAGEALLRGRKPRDARNAKLAEDTLGICPQHDVLWPTLTVREHLQLFAGLKGVPGQGVALEVDQTITRCDLSEKADSYVSTLSGGQKRKLSVAIAYLGGSRIVILDEPTSGMDPLSRRAIWDVVRMNKEGRTVVLTTHFMDEADHLGDRIAIMAVGKLRAWGTSMFLKERFGVGYTLTLVRNGLSDVEAIQQLVKAFVEGAIIRSEAGREIAFKLPKESRSSFPRLLRSLEGDEGLALGVENYELSVTSLEEVLMKIAVSAEEKDESILVRHDQKLSFDASGHEMTVINVAGKNQTVFQTGAQAERLPSFAQQTDTLFRKVVLLNRRQPILPIVRFVAPILATIVVAWMMRNLDGTCIPSPAEPVIPLQWPNKPLIVQPNNAIVSLVDPTVQPSVVADDTAYQFQVDNSIYNFTAALQFSTFAANADTSTWDGSYNAAQADFSGETVVQASLINLAHNAFIASRFNNTPATPAAPYAISSAIHRFSSPRAVDVSDGGTIGGALMLVAVLALLPALSTASLVRERMGKTMHQQRVSGARPLAYWLAYWLWDVINAFVIAAAATIIFAVFRTPMIKDALGWIFCSILLYLLSASAFGYALNSRFETSAGATGSILAILLGAGFFFVTMLMNLFYGAQSPQSTLNLVTGIVSAYSPAAGFVYNFLALANYGPLRCTVGDNELRTPSETIGFVLIIQIVQCFLFFFGAVGSDVWDGFVLWLSAKALRKRQADRGSAEDPKDEDEDVVRERQRVEKAAGKDSGVQIKRLIKSYGANADGREKHAVKGLSLGINRGDCFALLGPNGAGKTTTLSILAGDQLPSEGDCVVNGFSILDNLSRVQRSMGVTPQFDALLPTLTTREHLELYARLKGVPTIQIPMTVNALLQSLDLVPHADKQSRHLSGGNRRKLSVGIAVVGKPPVIILDEPSTGMDPVSKRLMWDLIQDLRTEHAVVLTTHSMEEAEAISTRIGIMTAGQLRCLGSAQHLRTRYGSGYQLDLRTSSKQSASQVQDFVSNTFPNAQLAEQGNRHLRYALSQHAVGSLATVFEAIEDYCQSVQNPGIEDYALSRTSLEQVFLDFARQAAARDEGDWTPTKVPFKYFTETSRMAGITATIANGLFALFGGFFLALVYIGSAFMVASTIVLLPGAWWILRRVPMAICPYGLDPKRERAQRVRKLPKWYLAIVNYGVIIVAGVFIAMLHGMLGCLLTLTVIFWPFAKIHFRLAALALCPVWS